MTLHLPKLRMRVVIVLALAGLLNTSSLWAVSTVKTVPVGHSPTQVVVDPSAHNIYVVNSTSNSVSVIDSKALTVKKTIAVGSSPIAIAANPPAGMVYVANSGSGTISAITGVKAAVTWTVGGTPVALAVDSGLNQLYVADSSANKILILDSAHGTVLQTLSIGALPTAMAVNIATHGLFVACTGTSGSVVVIDGTLKQIIKTVGSLPTGATSITIDPITNVALVVSPTANTSTAINAASNYSVVIQPGDTGADPIVAAYQPSAETGLFYAADTGDGNIFFCLGDGLFGFGNAYQTHLAGAHALAINPTTNQMGLVYPPGDGVYLIDLLNPLFDDNYFLLTSGLGVTVPAFDPLANKLFVTNNTDNTVTVFNIAPDVAVPAYESSSFVTSYDHVDTNPATGITYTAHLGNLFAINEAQAGAGFDGTGMNGAGVTKIPLGTPYPESLAVNAATNTIYVGDNQDFFYAVNGTTNVATLISGLPPMTRFLSLAADYATNQILGWDYANAKVLVLDGKTNQVLKTVTVPIVSNATLFVDPVRNLAYLATAPVSVIDPSTGTIVASIPLTGQGLYAAFNQGTNRLYVTTNSIIYAIDTTQNSVTATITLPLGNNIYSIGVNPVTGNYYVGANNNGVNHVFVYNGTSNTLVIDLSQTDHPELTGLTSIAANPLTNTMYVGTDTGSLTSSVVAIDGLTNVLSALPPSNFEYASHSLAVDLGTNVFAASGASYTTLRFPTSDPTGDSTVPISVSIAGVRDAFTITTKPIFRTTNTQPSFTITATSNYSQNAAALVPQHGFYQLDGWQGTWTPVNLKPKNGTNNSTAKVKLSTLTNGRHILYVYATDGDVATVQSNTVNSPVISPIGSVTFTVEQ